MKRTQIYLDDQQDAKLTKQSHVTRRTKSALIREAVDEYLARAASDGERLRTFIDAADAAFGIADYLPPGEVYVEELRASDRQRQQRLEERWRAGQP